MTALLVTGTGTGVGKTVVTAALAAVALATGRRVTVLKPGQTGELPGAPGDVDEVVRLAGPLTTVELVRYPDPLSPEAAARRSGLPTLTLDDCVAAVRSAERDADLVLVEGAGGLLVRYDSAGLTMADVAVAAGLPVVLVTAAGLGTLNATALTMEAMRSRGLGLHGLVVGAWPENPDLAQRCNLRDLATVTGALLSGVLPDGASQLDRSAFLAAAQAGLAPALGGHFDESAFCARESA